MTRQSLINYVRYELAILLTLVNCHSIEALNRSFASRDISLHSSSFAILHLVRLHVNEKVKNKSITKDRRDEFQRQSAKYETTVLLTLQETEVCYNEIVDWLAHFIIYFQIFDQNFIWSWMIYIACFLRSRNQWVCSRIKCARVFRVVLTTAIQLFYSFWFHTNSHYVISQCDDLICFRNDRIRDLQTYTCSRKSFASILDSDSLLDFSILEDFFNSFQFSSIVKNILSSVEMTVESY